MFYTNTCSPVNLRTNLPLDHSRVARLGAWEST
jgi:hypothetical protein